MLGEREKNADDAGLAAAAQVYSLTIVTRNEADFVGRGVDVINPFKRLPRAARPTGGDG
jgi:toxin FitB